MNFEPDPPLQARNHCSIADPLPEGVRGVRTNPPFRKPPPKNTNLPPPHPKRFDSIADVVFQVCPTPVNLLRFSLHDQLLGPLLSALRTPFSTLSDHPNMSNRLNLPKITKKRCCWRTVEDPGAILRQLKSVSFKRRRQDAAFEPVLDHHVDIIHVNKI